MWLSVGPGPILSFAVLERGCLASSVCNLSSLSLSSCPPLFYFSLSGVAAPPGIWIPCKMRFGRLSTANDEEAGHKALPIRLPLMKRNKQSAQDAKENVPPEVTDEHEKGTASTKASRRRTVIDFFKHKSGHKVEAEPENILERMSTQRTKSVSAIFRGFLSATKELTCPTE